MVLKPVILGVLRVAHPGLEAHLASRVTLDAALMNPRLKLELNLALDSLPKRAKLTP